MLEEFAKVALCNLAVPHISLSTLRRRKIELDNDSVVKTSFWNGIFRGYNCIRQTVTERLASRNGSACRELALGFALALAPKRRA